MKERSRFTDGHLLFSRERSSPSTPRYSKRLPISPILIVCKAGIRMLNRYMLDL